MAHLQPAAGGGQPESLNYQVTNDVIPVKVTDESLQSTTIL